jgi:hypothetical protein
VAEIETGSIPQMRQTRVALENALMSRINPSQTQIQLPDSIKWTGQEGFPRQSLENAVLAGSADGTGLYYALLKWYPGYMSAPHYYVTDRLCIVVSGIWWVNSGNDFDPGNCVPTPPGSFIRRVAGIAHYDGVIASGAEPAVIAICGMAPIDVKLVDPGQPGWRRA